MPSFPTDIPALDIVRGTQIERGENRLRTQMQQGPQKMRRLTSTAPQSLSLSHPNYSDTELNDLLAFYDDDLLDGSLSFTMTHPLTGSTDTFRFVVPPAYNAQGGDVWAISIQLERL